MTTKPEPKKTKGMCIATRCTSVEQFIQMFHRFVDEESFFVSTLNTREPGLETSFSVQLVDGTPVLRGLCVVMQAWTDTSNPFKTPGVRLGIKRLTANSMVVFEQLLITRSAKANPAGRATTGTGTPKVITPIATKPLGSAAPQPVTPATTKPMAGATKLKPPATIVVGVPKVVAVPKTLPKSPFTETAPTKHAPSRLELSQPARPSSESVPESISPEPTDVIEEKTDVREPRVQVALSAMPELKRAADADLAIPLADAEPIAQPSSDGARVLPLPPNDLRPPPTDVRQEVAAELDLAKPPDHNADDGRTPGSDLVLPANPLMNLTDESLEGYVDCTLYEETGNFFPADDEEAAADFVDDVVPPPGIESRVMPARVQIEPRQRTITPLPAAPDASFAANPDPALAVQRSPHSPAFAAVARDSSPALVAPPPLPPSATSRDNASVDPALVARGSTPAFEPELKAPLDTPTFSADGAPKATFDGDALPLPALDSRPQLAATPHKRPSWWLLGGLAGAVAAVIVVVAVIKMSSSNGDSAPSTKPASQVAQLTPPVAKPDPATDVTAAADEPEEATGDGPPAVGEGPCKVIVASTPAGSMVSIDGKTLGPSPLTVRTTCEEHKLDIAHARYQAISKMVTLTEATPETVDVTLQRPTHTVSVTSNPAGATIFIDGRRAGTTPTKLKVLGFVTVKLELKKTGYQPASEKLYSRYPQDTVSVRLTKW